MNGFEQRLRQVPQAALEFQASILEGVSRTFALTIPSLPEALKIPVTNAYLLCRIADTIEDDTALDFDQKREYERAFTEVLEGHRPAGALAADLAPRLGSSTLPDERTLVERCADVVGVTHALAGPERRALVQCVRLMSEGMHRFQRDAGLHGLRTLHELDEYCYFVAGVVGEMLTELFCEHAPDIAERRGKMMRLAPSFGAGLQMTNILKDIWDDRARGVCWLPRAEFPDVAEDVDDLIGSLDDSARRAGIERLAVVAHGHLKNALDYTLLIPPRHRGIRRFCLWALGMAVPTLTNVYRRSDFRDGAEVKITRRQVRGIVRRYGLFTGHDGMLRWQFRRASRKLPQSDPSVGDELVRLSRFEPARGSEAVRHVGDAA